jgi:SAM-dependent methyltransferase
VTGSDYGQIRAGLLQSYGKESARRRNERAKPSWKLAERAAFMARLHAEGCRTLLEIGAGTGQDSQFFATSGLDVVASDLSPAMVALCRAKGLRAQVMDCAAPSFLAASFDAVYTMNCLLHVPSAELPRVLAAICGLLRPGGLLFIGVYGGDGTEGQAADDDYVPPRFFSWRTGPQLLDFARRSFEVVDFHVVPLEGGDEFHALTLRRPRTGPAVEAKDA